jgi:hypothetical protein
MDRMGIFEFELDIIWQNIKVICNQENMMIEMMGSPAKWRPGLCLHATLKRRNYVQTNPNGKEMGNGKISKLWSMWGLFKASFISLISLYQRKQGKHGHQKETRAFNSLPRRNLIRRSSLELRTRNSPLVKGYLTSPAAFKTRCRSCLVDWFQNGSTSPGNHVV